MPDIEKWEKRITIAFLAVVIIALIFIASLRVHYQVEFSKQNVTTLVKGKVLFTSIYRDKKFVTFLLQDNKITPLSEGGMAKFLGNTGNYIGFWKYGFRCYDLTGKVLKDLQLPKEYSPLYFDIFPKSQMIVFTSCMGNRNNPWNLYTIDVDGNNLKQITDFKYLGRWSAGSPKFSPDGSKIAFEALKEPGNTKSPASIYIINKDGTDLKELFGNRFRGGIEPSWSPDGKTMVFVWTVDGYRNIFLVDLATLKVKQLTNFNKKNFGQALTPCFSPDGKQICFALAVRDTHAGAELFAINTDGSNLIRLTPAKRVSHYPYWATDEYPNWGE